MSVTTVSDIMTEAPATCTVGTDLGEIAQLMATHDCGAVPVVEGGRSPHPRGMVTDRDIVMRTVAEDIDPLKMKAADVMTNGALTVTVNDSVETCLDVMRENQVRRVIVVDDAGACCGIVALADIARHLDSIRTGEMVKHISKPSKAVSVPTM